MIKELENLWLEKSKDLANLFTLEPSVTGSDNVGANIVLGKTLVLYVGQSDRDVDATYYLFENSGLEPIRHAKRFPSNTILAVAPELMDEIVHNWTLHSNVAKFFMDKFNA